MIALTGMIEMKQEVKQEMMKRIVACNMRRILVAQQMQWEPVKIIAFGH